MNPIGRLTGPRAHAQRDRLRHPLRRKPHPGFLRTNHPPPVAWLPVNGKESFALAHQEGLLP